MMIRGEEPGGVVMPRLSAFLSLAGVILSLSCGTGVPAADPKPKDEKPVVKTYDVGGMIHKPGGRTGYDSIDEIVKLIITDVEPGSWGGEDDGKNRLRELNGTKLEIVTTPKNHKEIADLLEAHRRVNDCDVNLRAALYEIDRAVWEKEVRPMLNRQPAAPVGDVVVELLRKTGTEVSARDLPIANGGVARILSVRKAFTYIEKASAGEKRQINEYGTGFQGMSVCVTPVIAPDRRSVRLKIELTSAELLGLTKRTRIAVFGDADVREVTIERPELSEVTAATTLEVQDGAWALAAVAYRPADVRKKDRVWVLAVKPVIYIAEEDRERRNNPK
jgi:hypothetical protein